MIAHVIKPGGAATCVRGRPQHSGTIGVNAPIPNSGKARGQNIAVHIQAFLGRSRINANPIVLCIKRAGK